MERNSFVVPNESGCDVLSIIWLSSIQSGAALLPNDVRFSRNYVRHLALFIVLFRATYSHARPVQATANSASSGCVVLSLALARNTQRAQM